VSNSSDASGIASHELCVRVNVEAHIAFAHTKDSTRFVLKFCREIFLFPEPSCTTKVSELASVVIAVSQFISTAGDSNSGADVSHLLTSVCHGVPSGTHIRSPSPLTYSTEWGSVAIVVDTFLFVVITVPVQSVLASSI
jgi:hypothetical protein